MVSPDTANVRPIDVDAAVIAALGSGVARCSSR